MRRILVKKLRESLFSVLPVAAIVLLLAATPLLSLSPSELILFILCAFFLILGIGLFNLGADLAMTPMGEHVGSGLTKSKSLLLLLSVSFLMGVLVTIAEPDLSVLAEQVKDVLAKVKSGESLTENEQEAYSELVSHIAEEIIGNEDSINRLTAKVNPSQNVSTKELSLL